MPSPLYSSTRPSAAKLTQVFESQVADQAVDTLAKRVFENHKTFHRVTREWGLKAEKKLYMQDRLVATEIKRYFETHPKAEWVDAQDLKTWIHGEVEKTFKTAAGKDGKISTKEREALDDHAKDQFDYVTKGWLKILDEKKPKWETATALVQNTVIWEALMQLQKPTKVDGITHYVVRKSDVAHPPSKMPSDTRLALDNFASYFEAHPGVTEVDRDVLIPWLDAQVKAAADAASGGSAHVTDAQVKKLPENLRNDFIYVLTGKIPPAKADRSPRA